MKTVLEILKGAREILTPAGAWCQQFAARDSKGRPAMTSSPDACSFCLIGAIHRAAGEGTSRAFEAEAYTRQEIDASIVQWNDYPLRTQEQVLSVLDKVIEKCGATIST